MEIVVALIVISVAFTALLDLLSGATGRLEKSERMFMDLLTLDGKLKLGDHDGLEVKRRSLPDFPRIKEVNYSYGDLFFVRYEAR